MQEFARIIAYVSVFTNLAPLVVAGWRFRGLGGGQKALALLLALGLVVQVVAFLLGRAGINNYFLFHVYIPLEFGLFLLVFYLERLFFARKAWLLGLAIGLAVLGILNSVWGDGWYQMPAKTFLVEGGIMVIAGVLYFWQVFREMKIWRVEAQPMFWVSLGMWVYFLGGMLIVVFDGYLQKVSEDTYFFVWGIHSSLVILTGILFAIGLLCKTQAQKS
jgi:hypothetical protein